MNQPDTCYYCGEEMDDGPCSENDDNPHESQREFDELVRKAEAELQRQRDELSDKVRTMTKTSDGCAI